MLSPEHARALESRLEALLPGQGPVRLVLQERVFGGASRQTIRIDAERDGTRHLLILRRDPAASLIETERKLEFAALATFAGGPVPVPKPLLLEEDPALLGAPFFVMERIEGALPGSPFQSACYAPHAQAIARQFFWHLGAIAARPLAGSPLAAVLEPVTADTCWSRELARWEAVILEDAPEPQPVALAAIRRLRRTPPPPPPRVGIVHGDYRSGNFLHDGAGSIRAILDWEMVHAGDPHEDLAWALDPLWAHDPARPLTGIGREEAITLWEAASGLACNRDALAWWGLFSAVKGLAIWLSAGRAFASGANGDLVNAWSAWMCGQFHERQLAQALLDARMEGNPA